jgi:hypothetical protein
MKWDHRQTNNQSDAPDVYKNSNMQRRKISNSLTVNNSDEDSKYQAVESSIIG